MMMKISMTLLTEFNITLVFSWDGLKLIKLMLKNSYTYDEFSKYHVWNQRAKEWTEWQERACLGRLPFLHPNFGKRYYLRMLLTIIRDAKSFAGLRTIDGIKYATFREACMTLRLVANNSEWNDALFKAYTWVTRAQLQSMFYSLLMYNEVGQAELIWDKH